MGTSLTARWVSAAQSGNSLRGWPWTIGHQEGKSRWFFSSGRGNPKLKHQGQVSAASLKTSLLGPLQRGFCQSHRRDGGKHEIRQTHQSKGLASRKNESKGQFPGAGPPFRRLEGKSNKNLGKPHAPKFLHPRCTSQDECPDIKARGTAGSQTICRHREGAIKVHSYQNL